VIFPFAKVANVPRPTNACCPCRTRFHHSVIQANGKQNRTAISGFSLKRSFNFIFNPRAPDRVF
jgi:hypothetical protein